MAKKKVVVISLGGSLIVPEKVDIKFLNDFEKTLKKHAGKYKFVVVCGGGTVARKYIDALRMSKSSKYLQSLAGISVTRLNARFMSYLFGKDPELGIPHDMKHVAGLLRKNNIVFCGALRYAPHQTSDATSAQLAAYFKSDFINLTNVKGLFSKNPLKYKDAKFISQATRQELAKIVNAIPQKPGMHAPVDHTAMKIILQNKLRVFILGKDARQLDNLLNERKFVGTRIE